jgi:hypothetical protein
MRDRWDVTLVGQQAELGATVRRVTPELIHEHDAVVSIGKTVQYALAAGVPVFCYDHFGGPGWLNDGNVEAAARHNFSGRGFTARDSASELVEEIGDGYRAARAGVGGLSRYAPLLGQRLHEVIADVRAPSRLPLDDSDVTAHIAIQSSLGIFMVMASELEEARRWYSQYASGLEARVEDLAIPEAQSGELAAARREVAKLEKDLHELLVEYKHVFDDLQEVLPEYRRVLAERTDLESLVAELRADAERDAELLERAGEGRAEACRRDAATAQLVSVLASRWWRVSAPVRLLERALRRRAVPSVRSLVAPTAEIEMLLGHVTAGWSWRVTHLGRRPTR